MRRIVLTLFLLTTLLTALPLSALQIVSPEVLCDRFVTQQEKNQCLSAMKTKKPDTYVGSVCQNIFDDQIFYQCIDLAAKNIIDPKKLDSCDSENITDNDRMKCLRSLQARKTLPFQRLPASLPAEKSKRH